MSKIVSTGLHELDECFRESICQIKQELDNLRGQLSRGENEQRALKDKAGPGYLLVGIEVLVAVVLLVAGFQVNSYYEYPPQAYQLVAIIIIGVLIGIASLTYNLLLVSPESSRLQLVSQSAGLRSQQIQKTKEYESTIIEQLRNSANKKGELVRLTKRGEKNWFVFCPSFTAMVDFSASQMMLLNTKDCRDVQLSYKEIERRSYSHGAVSSNAGSSLASAAIGGLFFGGTGLIGGSIVGSSGSRTVSFSTTEKSVGKYLVDVYTKLQEYPVITVDFDSDDRQAKEYYAVVSAAITSANC